MPGLLELQALQKQSDSIDAEKFSQFDTESFRFIKFLLDNEKENLPANIMKIFWPFFDKEVPLSNFDNVDVKVMMDELRIAILNLKMSVPDFKKTYNDIINLDGLRPKFYARIKRATGGMQRERALESTQIRQFLTNEMETAKGGILSRIAGIFGGRK